MIDYDHYVNRLGVDFCSPIFPKQTLADHATQKIIPTAGGGAVEGRCDLSCSL
ncbi:MAG: hypothetical protein M0O96_05685 [Desulforhopalus sp.]|nr:hypothetical protein [Desulforhopalus sp.]